MARPDQALIGKLAGVQILTTNAQAGAAPTIQVRGAASITAGSSPLIVVDGYPVPTDLSAIDMNDVESIEVLKDAASAAIYGSRGANGVVIVTTKSGKSGKTKVTLQYLRRRARNTVKRLPLYNLDEWAAYVRRQNNDVLSPQIQTAQRFNANTDAQDIVFRTGNMQSYQANVQGGTDAAKFFVSGSYLKNKGVVHEQRLHQVQRAGQRGLQARQALRCRHQPEPLVRRPGRAGRVAARCHSHHSDLDADVHRRGYGRRNRQAHWLLPAPARLRLGPQPLLQGHGPAHHLDQRRQQRHWPR